MPAPSIPGLRDLQRIGVGGFAEVFRAVEDPFDRVVAVKVLTTLHGDADAVRAFERECRALGQVDGHPNIVTVHSAGTTDDGRPYLVMSHESGGTLQDRLDAGERPDPVALLRLGADLADALATAHRSGVLHRDVKPANVLVSSTGVPKLSDFGIARLVDETATGGKVTASLLHAPPEQIDGKPATPAGDAYSLGSTLATLALGHPPYLPGAEDNVMALLSRIALQPPPDLRAAGHPPEVAEVVAALMQKDPAARPQDLALVAAHLRQVADRLAGGGAAPAVGPSGGPAVATRIGRGRRVAWAALGLAVLVLGAVGAVLALGDEGGAVPPLEEVAAAELPESVDLSDPDVLAGALFDVGDLPDDGGWIETEDTGFARPDSLGHPAALFDVCQRELDPALFGAAAQRFHFDESGSGNAIGASAVEVVGDGEALERQVVDAYRACTTYENSLRDGGSERTEVVSVEEVPVGPYTGLRTRIRFPSDGQVLSETRVLVDGVWLTLQVDDDRIDDADRDHLLAVMLTNLAGLS
ncbi:serine/threonine-protein kinase [Euzebya sp.]|uniref:serine/threonine-protein kinase n=1 Tax=Euzebya sp. TaxID=1971409 RepID=UPI00351793D8